MFTVSTVHRLSDTSTVGYVYVYVSVVFIVNVIEFVCRFMYVSAYIQSCGIQNGIVLKKHEITAPSFPVLRYCCRRNA